MGRWSQTFEPSCLEYFGFVCCVCVVHVKRVWRVVLMLPRLREQTCVYTVAEAKGQEMKVVKILCQRGKGKNPPVLAVEMDCFSLFLLYFIEEQ